MLNVKKSKKTNPRSIKRIKCLMSELRHHRHTCCHPLLQWPGVFQPRWRKLEAKSESQRLLRKGNNATQDIKKNRQKDFDRPKTTNPVSFLMPSYWRESHRANTARSVALAAAECSAGPSGFWFADFPGSLFRPFIVQGFLSKATRL